MNRALPISDLKTSGPRDPALVTVGVFDGVHLGHQQLLSRLSAHARAESLQAVVVTFFPHPDIILRGLRGRYYLTTPEEKAQRLRAAGMDEVLTLAFDDNLRQMDAAAFCARLRQGLNMRTLAVGRDFALGHRREGDVDRLGQLGQEQGFELLVTDLVTGSEGRISSTAIRERWKPATWNVRGVGSGTATRSPARLCAVRARASAGLSDCQHLPVGAAGHPANGVYASYVWLGEERFLAATNVGVRPHFGEESITVEPFILDFDAKSMAGS